ncbi:hypothetical protein ACJZ2D_000109 [Fusarium nematophilum]
MTMLRGNWGGLQRQTTMTDPAAFRILPLSDWDAAPPEEGRMQYLPPTQAQAARNYPCVGNAPGPVAIAIVQHQTLPDPESPRRALGDQRIARLFHSYTSEISQWYDLSDTACAFGLLVPTIALEEPLLFCAVIALSAMHVCKTSAGSFREIAEFYHHRCVRRLIALSEDDELISRGVALAATCLLRSYEILEGEIDPNMHLRGAYSMASLHHVLSGNLQQGLLLGAGFWNYLREDITFSLFEKCPLKMDLESTPLLGSHRSDQDFLNSITLILGKIINMTFDREMADSEWTSAANMVKVWRSACPEHLRPFSRGRGQPGASHLFPAVWFLQPCHAATMHYYLVALTILCVHSNPKTFADMESLDLLTLELRSEDDLVEDFAMEICGIAFTAKIPSVLVNAFGPMAYCGRFIRAEPARQELTRQLLACKSSIGWPVQRLVDGLESFWRADQS